MKVDEVSRRASRLRRLARREGRAQRPVRISGVAYSGSVLRSQASGQVIVDLRTLEVPADLWLLWGHSAERESVVGKVTGWAVTGRGLEIEGQAWPVSAGYWRAMALADLGRSLSLSVHVQPQAAEVSTGPALVNHRLVTGGCKIWNHARLLEVSLVERGLDQNAWVTFYNEDAPSLLRGVR